MNALVMYDHQTDTLWSQFLSRGVKGPLSNTQLEILPVLQTTWQQWVDLHPETLVLNKGGRYQTNTYEGYYRGGARGIIGESNKDRRLPPKDLVLGVDLAGIVKAYPFQIMADQGAINDFFFGNYLLVAFDPLSETGAAFDRTVEGSPLTFEALPEQSPRASVGDGDRDRLANIGYPGGEFLLRDQETGSTWQALTGRAIDGPLAGTALTRLPSFYSFWFAWSDFHPSTEVYGLSAGPG